MSLTRIQGIQSIQQLLADQTVTNSVVPVAIQNSATDQFTFNLGAAKSLYWELTGIFNLGATGGFRFLAHCTVAPTIYNFQAVVEDLTTPAQFLPASAGVLTEAAFTNAAAVASNYTVNASGLIVAAGATVFTLQFAQNNATANPITLKAGMTLKLWQL